MGNFHNNIRRDFLGSASFSIKPKVYTIIVIYLDGYKKEYPAIDNPWKYMAQVKKNPKVKSCYIK